MNGKATTCGKNNFVSIIIHYTLLRQFLIFAVHFHNLFCTQHTISEVILHTQIHVHVAYLFFEILMIFILPSTSLSTLDLYFRPWIFVHTQACQLCSFLGISDYNSCYREKNAVLSGTAENR